MGHPPTKEQQLCITAIQSGIRMLKVSACAGSGKTSTLGMMSEAEPVPSIYLCFNKKTAEEAAGRFPRYVTCSTGHSVAYRQFGAMLRSKLERPKGGYVNVAGTGSEIARFYSISSFESKDGIVVPNGFIGLLVKGTVANFEQSDKKEVLIDHVPTYELREKLGDGDGFEYVKKQVFGFAKKLWADRSDVKSPVLATHDTYFKLFQLSEPILVGYEVLYVDEWQDSTPCFVDVVLRQQPHMRIVMVGDARQAIYGWRGAVNAMELVNCETKYLTKSFRYGQAIADVATAVLERDMVITGFEKINSVAGAYNIVDRTQPYTRLFRTNSGLLYAAIEEIARGTEVAIEIDVKDFVKLLESAMALEGGDKKNAKHDKVLAYVDWAELVAESKHDAELGRMVKIINEGLGHQWSDLLKTFKNSKTPHVTFTSAHKSKGREFTQVVVENDFKSCYNAEGEWVGISTEEQNLLYVANTRAIKALEYNSTTSEYVQPRRKTNGKSFDKWLNRKLGFDVYEEMDAH